MIITATRMANRTTEELEALSAHYWECGAEAIAMDDDHTAARIDRVRTIIERELYKRYLHDVHTGQTGPIFDTGE